MTTYRTIHQGWFRCCLKFLLKNLLRSMQQPIFCYQFGFLYDYCLKRYMKLLIKIFIYRYFNRYFQFGYWQAFFMPLFQEKVFLLHNMIIRKLEMGYLFASDTKWNESSGPNDGNSRNCISTSENPGWSLIVPHSLTRQNAARSMKNRDFRKGNNPSRARQNIHSDQETTWQQM